MTEATTPDRRIALQLSLCFALFYLLSFHAHFTGTDETAVFLETQALYEHGRLSVPRPGPHRFEGPDGRVYTHFAIGQSVLALPFYAIGDALHGVVSGDGARIFAAWPPEPGRIDAMGGARIFAVSLYPPLASGLLVGLFYLFERRLGASVRSALAASALLGTTTYVAGMSVYFLRHTTEALFVLGSLLALYTFRRGAGVGALLAGALLASATLLVRVPAAVCIPALAAYGLFVALERRDVARTRVAAAAVLPALLVLAVHSAVNRAKWGTLVSSPMLDQVHLFDGSLATGAAGLLFSPGAGLIFYSPLVLLSPWWLRDFAARHRAECVVTSALCLTFLLVAARFHYWSGLWSAPGPRYLFVLTPLLLLPLGPWLDERRGAATRVGLAGLAIAGACVQVVLMVSRWSSVIRSMGYRELEGQGFLFSPGLSPILGSAQVVADGGIDAWLWRLGAAPPNGAGLPGVASALFIAWLASFCVGVWRLRDMTRKSS